MTKKKAVPATEVTCSNTSLEQITAYLNGRQAKRIEQLKNLAYHFDYKGSFNELSQLFLPQTK